MNTKFFKIIWPYFLFFLIFSITISITYFSFSFLWNKLTQINEELGAAIIIAAGTILVSVISIVLGKIYEQRQIVIQEITKHKIEAYDILIDFFFNHLFLSAHTGKELSKDELSKHMGAITKSMIFWGSDDVIIAWSRYRDALTKYDSKSPEYAKATFSVLGKLLLTIRKDTGHKNNKIDSRLLLSLFITDIDKVGEELSLN